MQEIVVDFGSNESVMCIKRIFDLIFSGSEFSNSTGVCVGGGLVS